MSNARKISFSETNNNNEIENNQNFIQNNTENINNKLINIKSSQNPRDIDLINNTSRNLYNSSNPNNKNLNLNKPNGNLINPDEEVYLLKKKRNSNENNFANENEFQINLLYNQITEKKNNFLNNSNFIYSAGFRNIDSENKLYQSSIKKINARIIRLSPSSDMINFNNENTIENNFTGNKLLEKFNEEENKNIIFDKINEEENEEYDEYENISNIENLEENNKNIFRNNSFENKHTSSELAPLINIKSQILDLQNFQYKKISCLKKKSNKIKNKNNISYKFKSKYFKNTQTPIKTTENLSINPIKNKNFNVITEEDIELHSPLAPELKLNEQKSEDKYNISLQTEKDKENLELPLTLLNQIKQDKNKFIIFQNEKNLIFSENKILFEYDKQKNLIFILNIDDKEEMPNTELQEKENISNEEEFQYEIPKENIFNENNFHKEDNENDIEIQESEILNLNNLTSFKTINNDILRFQSATGTGNNNNFNNDYEIIESSENNLNKSFYIEKSSEKSTSKNKTEKNNFCIMDIDDNENDNNDTQLNNLPDKEDVTKYAYENNYINNIIVLDRDEDMIMEVDQNLENENFNFENNEEKNEDNFHDLLNNKHEDEKYNEKILSEKNLDNEKILSEENFENERILSEENFDNERILLTEEENAQDMIKKDYNCSENLADDLIKVNFLKKYEKFLKKNRRTGKNKNVNLFSNEKLHFFNPINNKYKENSNISDFKEVILEDEIFNLENLLLEKIIREKFEENNLNEDILKQINSKIKKLKDFDFNPNTNILIDDFLKSNNFKDSNTSKKFLISVIIGISLILSLYLLGYSKTNPLRDFFNSKITLGEIILIITLSIMIEFLIFFFFKKLNDYKETQNIYKNISRISSDIINQYLLTIKDYDFNNFSIRKDFFIEKISKELKISQEIFKEKIYQQINSEKKDFIYINYLNIKGEDNGYWKITQNEE